MSSQNKEIMNQGRVDYILKVIRNIFWLSCTFYHPYDCIGFTRRGHYGRLQRL